MSRLRQLKNDLDEGGVPMKYQKNDGASSHFYFELFRRHHTEIACEIFDNEKIVGIPAELLRRAVCERRREL
jgi:hypothetical protein